jgi:hypothetical protein
MAEVEATEPESNGAAPHEVEVAGEVRAEAKVCMPCLIARGVLLLAATALLVFLIIQERRKAQKSGTGSSGG